MSIFYFWAFYQKQASSGAINLGDVNVDLKLPFSETNTYNLVDGNKSSFFKSRLFSNNIPKVIYRLTKKHEIKVIKIQNFQKIEKYANLKIAK